jgi:hypothetical protein
VFYAVVYPIVTAGRLADLNISRLWVLPLALSWVPLIFALWQHTSGRISLILALAFVVVVHLPLILIPSRNFETLKPAKL